MHENHFEEQELKILNIDKVFLFWMLIFDSGSWKSHGVNHNRSNFLFK